MRFLTTTLALLIFTANFVLARPAAEDARIEYLLHSVETLKGAKFVRNGSAYDAGAAVSHLRLKLGKAGERVKTAEDFIDGLASKSSFSGKPYTIRMADGETVKTAQFFHDQLRKYDASH